MRLYRTTRVEGRATEGYDAVRSRGMAKVFECIIK